MVARIRKPLGSGIPIVYTLRKETPPDNGDGSYHIPTNLTPPWLYVALGVHPCPLGMSAVSGSYSAYKLVWRTLITLRMRCCRSKLSCQLLGSWVCTYPQ